MSLRRLVPQVVPKTVSMLWKAEPASLSWRFTVLILRSLSKLGINIGFRSPVFFRFI